VFLDMWGSLPTNKVVGALWANDGDGNAWGDKERGFPPALAKAGYKLVDPGRYPNLTDDFSAQISAFKGAGVEIVTGVPIPPDWTTFWKQAAQQGFKPKIASVGKALLFPRSVEALGDLGIGMSTEVWWTPHHPFKSSLTGVSQPIRRVCTRRYATLQASRDFRPDHQLLHLVWILRRPGGRFTRARAHSRKSQTERGLRTRNGE
jgi:hypothetical protein